MSQLAPSGLSEGQSASSLTVVVLLLVPCVVLLLLLNCLFLVCKLLVLSKRRCRSRRGAAEEMLLRSTLHAVSDVSLSPLPSRRGDRASPPERVITHPVTSSRASSREAHGAGYGMRLLTPDGAAGFQGALSTIRTTASSCPRVTPGREPLSALRRSAPILTQFSDSEVRVNLVPPNSPTASVVPKVWSAELFGAAGELQGGRRNLEEAELLLPQSYSVNPDVAPDVATLRSDFLDQPSQTSSCSGSSAVGPGLDSDFGASAGVSLRILSADSDGVSSGALTSALEWDYYDPCYVRQNNVPRAPTQQQQQQRRRPALHSKHYWV